MLLLKYLVVHLRHLIEDHVPQSSHPVLATTQVR